MDISLALKIRRGPEIASMQIGSWALSILKEIEPYFSERKIEAYLVGGFVRDILMNRSTADIDLAIADDALKVAREIADALGGKFVLLDEANRIARVVLPTDPTSTWDDWHIDLSTLDRDIQQDLKRRDFTIDAMAVDLKSFIRNPDDFEIIDPLGGRKDTELRLISAASETNFEADPARLLRAVRLAAELNFNITSETEALMRQFHLLIGRVAGERVGKISCGFWTLLRREGIFAIWMI